MSGTFLPARNRLAVDDDHERSVLGALVELERQLPSMPRRRDLYVRLSGVMSKNEAAERIVALAARGLVEAGEDAPQHGAVVTAAGLAASGVGREAKTIVNALVRYFVVRLEADGVGFHDFRSEQLMTDLVIPSRELLELVPAVVRAFGLSGGSSSSSDGATGAVQHYWFVPSDIYEYRYFTSWTEVYDLHRVRLRADLVASDDALLTAMRAVLKTDTDLDSLGALRFREVWNRSKMAWPTLELAVEAFRDAELVRVTEDGDLYLNHDVCRDWLRDHESRASGAPKVGPQTVPPIELPPPSASPLIDCRALAEQLRPYRRNHVDLDEVEAWLLGLEMRSRTWLRARDPASVADIPNLMPSADNEIDAAVRRLGSVPVAPILSALTRLAVLLAHIEEQVASGTVPASGAAERASATTVVVNVSNSVVGAIAAGNGSRAHGDARPSPASEQGVVGLVADEERFIAAVRAEIAELADPIWQVLKVLAESRSTLDGVGRNQANLVGMVQDLWVSDVVPRLRDTPTVARLKRLVQALAPGIAKAVLAELLDDP